MLCLGVDMRHSYGIYGPLSLKMGDFPVKLVIFKGYIPFWYPHIYIYMSWFNRNFIIPNIPQLFVLKKSHELFPTRKWASRSFQRSILGGFQHLLEAFNGFVSWNVFFGTHVFLYLQFFRCVLRIFLYSGCQNYRTERRGQKYGKIPYLCPLPGSNLERSRKI